MKLLEIKFLKSCNAIIGVVLTLIGFASSCIFQTEYGTPSAKFIVNGKVESAGDNKAIENIRVIMQWDSVKTDSNGNFQIIENDFPLRHAYNIHFRDIDNALNGQFKNLDTVVVFNDPVFTGGDKHWYKGETTLEFNIKLNPVK